MNILKAFTDMKDMVEATPDMLRSANQISAAAQAQAAQFQGSTAGAAVAAANPGPAPTAEELAPINGVTLEQYAAISKDLGSVGYDPNRSAEVAARHGVASADWGAAQKGWGDRIRANRAVGVEFNKYYTA